MFFGVLVFLTGIIPLATWLNPNPNTTKHGPKMFGFVGGGLILISVLIMRVGFLMENW
jgi:hypothetical protein